MIRIRSHYARVPRSPSALHSIIHHALGGAARAGHFPDRLLCEYGQNSAARAIKSCDMPGRGKTEPIAETEAGG
jgi:hypothetical protein